MATVTIIEVDREDPVEVADAPGPGYPALVGTEHTCGRAVVVPGPGQAEALVAGAVVHARPGHEAIEDVRTVDAERHDLIRPLESAGDYEVIGRVDAVDDDGVVHVVAHGFAFRLVPDELEGTEPVPGDRVGFTLRDLHLIQHG